MLMLLCLLAAAIVGFAAHQGGTCGVVAVRRWVEARDARLLLGFGVALGAATALCLPLAWLLGRGASLPGSVPLAPPLLAGAVLLGVGAVVNGACLVGSLWRLGNGEAHLLALPAGLVAGDMLGAALGWRVEPPASGFARPDAAGVLLVLGGVLLLGLAWRRLGGLGAARLAATMAAMGAAGSLLFVALPGWTWADVLIAHARQLPQAGEAAVRASIATLAGALASGWISGQLHLKWRGWPAAARSLLGGVVMMLGVRLIPGGNDALLLGAAPAGAWSALVAFGLMNLVILLLAMVPRLRPVAPPARR